MAGGPKGKYETHVKPKLTLISAWARNGLTYDQIARNVKVAPSTFFEYMKKHPELLESLKDDREAADLAVENALYKKACEGDNTAMIFWLKNRQPKKWRDRQETEHSGNIELTGMTIEQAEELIKKFMEGGK